MGCDWYEGTASFGHSVQLDDFSFEKFEDPSELVRKGEVREAKEFIPQCWKVFCANLSPEDKLIVKDIDCLISRSAMPPCHHGSDIFSDKCCFVFGIELKNADSLDEIAKVQEKKNLHEKVAHFLYLFNETDSFAKHFGKSEKQFEQIKIDTSINAEAKQEINELADLIKSPNILIGC